MHRTDMGLASSINGWLDRTNSQREKVVALAMAGRLRLASRFFLGVSPENKHGTKNEKFDLPALVQNIGYNYNGPAPVAKFIVALATAMGMTFDLTKVETILKACGYEPNAVLPITTIVRNILKLNLVTRKQTKSSRGNGNSNGDTNSNANGQQNRSSRRRRHGRSQGKKNETTATMPTVSITTPSVMKFDLVSGLINWISGTNNRSIKVANTVGMRLYGIAPSVRDVSALALAMSVTFDVLVIGDNLVVYGWSRETAGSLQYGSKPTIYDIQTSTHQVPFTGKLIQLLQNGYLPLADLGIMDAQAFNADAFEQGLNSVFATWFRAISAMNKVNTKIAAGVSKVKSIDAQTPITKQTVAEIAEPAGHVYDDVQGSHPFELGKPYGSRELVGAAMDSTPYGTSNQPFSH